MSRSSTFTTQARRAASEWKAATHVLPESSRASAGYRGAGDYEFCLPTEDADHNLLSEAREIGLARFRAAGIPWHDGIGDGPSNHLLSSQVQCVNALAPMVDGPDAVAAAFDSVLPIDEVLLFGGFGTGNRFDETDYVVFEWIGEDNPLGESLRDRRRGSMATSADAAFRYRARDGSIEAALVEWKYTEQYQGDELSGGQPKNATRQATYKHLWDDPDSPVRTDLIPYEDLFVEPFYQLLRLQLLAWRLEADRALGADCVRLVYVAPATNLELARSFNRPSHNQFSTIATHRQSTSIWETWWRMLRRPDRFRVLDSAALVAAGAPTTDDYKARYGHIASGERVSVTPPATTPQEIRDACSTATEVVERVFGDGGVVNQVAELADRMLEDADPWVLASARARLEEITELARQLRAEDIFEILDIDREPH